MRYNYVTYLGSVITFRALPCGRRLEQVDVSLGP